MKAQMQPKYSLIEQEPYCCVPACIQMMLSRRQLPLLSQEEIGIDLGLTVPQEEVHHFQNIPTTEMPPEGWGTRINLVQYSLNEFFRKRQLPLRNTYSTPEEIEDVPEYIAESISQGKDLLVCFRYGSLYRVNVPFGHGSLIEAIDDRTLTLADPHGTRKKASVDRLVKSIDKHRKGDMALSGFWRIE